MSTTFRPARIEDLIAEAVRSYQSKRAVQRTEKKPRPSFVARMRGKK